MSTNLAIQENSAQDRVDPLASPNLSVKLFLEEGPFPTEKVREVFHAWIREGRLDNELLIDVTSYAHLHQGPKLILIGHEAQYTIDASGGRLGLVYSKRRRDTGSFEARFTRALSKVSRAAKLLEAEAGLRFDTKQIRLSIVDGLRAPNTPAVFAQVLPAVTEALRSAHPTRAIDVAHAPGDGPFSLTTKLSEFPSLEELIVGELAEE